MFILNTGIGVILYGIPILLILMTFLVSVIEAIYLKKYLTFWRLFKKLAFANFVTSLLGMLFIILLNTTDSLRVIASVLTEGLKLEKFSLPYTIAIIFAITLPNYAITVLIEWIILKRIMLVELTLRSVAEANLISYLVLILISIMFFSS